ncbi:hypothetical protein Tco_1453033 [Tanacetum coccineum]
MIKESINATIVVERARQANVRNDASGSGLVRGQETAYCLGQEGEVCCCYTRRTCFDLVEIYDCRVWFDRRSPKNGAQTMELEGQGV